MTNRTTAALVGTTGLTVATATAIIGSWPAQDPLITVTAAAWVIVAILATADHIDTVIRRTADRLADTNDQHHAAGVIEGMRATTPATPLRGLH